MSLSNLELALRKSQTVRPAFFSSSWLKDSFPDVYAKLENIEECEEIDTSTIPSFEYITCNEYHVSFPEELVNIKLNSKCVCSGGCVSLENADSKCINALFGHYCTPEICVDYSM